MMRLLLLLVFALPLVAQLPQPSRVLWEIQMQDGSGQELSDSSGNGRNWCRGQDGGSPTCNTATRNDPTWETVGGETVLRYNGTDQMAVSGDDYSALFGSNQATACITWKRDVNVPAGSGQTGGWSVGTNTSVTQYPWTSGQLNVTALRSANINFINDILDKSEWHTYCVTHEVGANNYILYQNATSFFTSTGDASITFPTPARIGSSQFSGWFEGDQSHFAIWDIVLTPQEVADYHCYSRGLKPGLAMTDIGCVAAVPGPGLLSVISLASAGAPAAETTTPCASFAPTEWAAAGLPLDPFDVDATATQYGDACLPLLPPMPSRVTVP